MELHISLNIAVVLQLFDDLRSILPYKLVRNRSDIIFFIRASLTDQPVNDPFLDITAEPA